MSNRFRVTSRRSIRHLCILALAATAAAPALAQAPAVVGQVYDADGAFVGTVIDYDSVQQSARVHGLIQGSVVEFTIRNENIAEYLDPEVHRVYFGNGDCTGQAYAPGGFGTYPALGGILAGAGDQYFFAPSGTPAGTFGVGSYRDFEVAACNSGAVVINGYPVTGISLAYTLPYSMSTQTISQGELLPVPAVDGRGLFALALALAAAGLLGLRARDGVRARSGPGARRA
ncbi:MAG: hypothetical protein H6511_00915 [Holophagales bacterium]|nr:hypothetical protein [Holophagales bacterium]